MPRAPHSRVIAIGVSYHTPPNRVVGALTSMLEQVEGLAETPTSSVRIVGFAESSVTYEIREWQWRQAFANADGNWFCFVIERQNGDLIGFAKGIPYTGDLPDFAGELNKIYLLREYQRLGLGSRLIGYVARRFLSQCIQSMLLFGEARNPSNRFYEALGAERLLTDSGEFHGGYGWRDLRSLEARCPIE